MKMQFANRLPHRFLLFCRKRFHGYFQGCTLSSAPSAANGFFDLQQITGMAAAGAQDNHAGIAIGSSHGVCSLVDGFAVPMPTLPLL
jgi:hypothetical protein